MQRLESKQRQFNINDVRLTSRTAQYAVRGRVPNRAQQISQELKQLQEQHGGIQQKYPFQELTQANIGNPQIFGQPPMSFNREVLAGILYPQLLQDKKIGNKDVEKRINHYLQNIKGNVGAYTESTGYQFARESVSEFIKRRDGLQKGPETKDLILLQGASEGVVLAFSTFIQNTTDGIMIPIPQYPLYSAQISLHGGSQVNYYLNEEGKWSIDLKELQRSFNDSVKDGVNPRILCVINPGNPTGVLLTEKNIEEMIKFAYENNLLVIADEVYQENVYVPGQKFISFNKVLNSMPKPYNQTQVLSLHSTSKGIIGECGIRGGYMQLSNIDPEVQAQIVKLKSIGLCSNTIGQLTTELMVNPPREGAGFDQETIDSHKKECESLFTGLQNRSKLITEMLNSMDNITSQPAEAAMYAFPQIKFSQKAIDAAKEQDMEPDLFYCLQVLEQVGLVIVPGSGFGQKPGTYHFRITNLIRPESKLQEVMQKFNQFNTQFHQKYA